MLGECLASGNHADLLESIPIIGWEDIGGGVVRSPITQIHLVNVQSVRISCSSRAVASCGVQSFALKWTVDSEQ
jgi:hypothetical protein